MTSEPGRWRQKLIGKIHYYLFKKALNRYFARRIGGAQRLTFFDIETTYPPLAEVTRHYEPIRREFETIIRRRTSMPRYHDVDPGERSISATTEKNWDVFVLSLLGHKPPENRALCPKTSAVLDKVPRVFQAFFSVLEPGKSIPLHEGPYLGLLRYHLGVQIPERDPPMLVLNGQQYIWKAGEAVLFDDTWPHEVHNQSDDLRAVLIIDVLRPMPWLPSLVNRAATQLILRHTYGRPIVNRVRRFAASETRKGEPKA